MSVVLSPFPLIELERNCWSAESECAALEAGEYRVDCACKEAEIYWGRADMSI